MLLVLLVTVPIGTRPAIPDNTEEPACAQVVNPNPCVAFAPRAKERYSGSNLNSAHELRCFGITEYR